MCSIIVPGFVIKSCVSLLVWQLLFLIRVPTVCLCPTKRTLGLYGLIYTMDQPGCIVSNFMKNAIGPNILIMASVFIYLKGLYWNHANEPRHVISNNVVF